jgi:hypothetical protein
LLLHTSYLPLGVPNGLVKHHAQGRLLPQQLHATALFWRYHRVAGCVRLCFLDAYSGYNQIKLKKEDEKKTAFITPYGVICYQVMRFGLKNAGATYERMMQNCLGSQIGCNIQVYIDDMVITTRKEESLISDLAETFDNLNRYNLKLNPTKCSFGVSAPQLLGLLVSARGIEANPEKIQAILTMGKPAKLHDMQKLVGRVVALS